MLFSVKSKGRFKFIAANAAKGKKLMPTPRQLPYFIVA
jgi:hypothetical protein